MVDQLPESDAPYVVYITKLSAPTEAIYGPFETWEEVDYFVLNYPEKWIRCLSVQCTDPASAVN
jgi:hypothetical protein